MLALGANALIQPPHRGVIEEQSLNRNLKKIYEWIKPLDVRQFVRDHRLQLFLRKTGESAYRQQNNGTKPPNHCWRLQPLALAVMDDAIQTQLALQRPAHGKHPVSGYRGLLAALPLQKKE